MKGFFPAEVIENHDPLKQGRIQVKIDHLHLDLGNDALPWAIQCSLLTGGSNYYGSSSIPEMGSHVWVWYEDVDIFYKQPYYIADLQFQNKNPHALFYSNIKPNIEGCVTEYPDMKYVYFRNNICVASSASCANPEFVISHPKGTYVFIDKEGQVTIKKVEAEINLKNENNIEIKNKETSLKIILEMIADLCSQINTVGGPAAQSLVPDLVQKFTVDLKQEIAKVFKT